MTSHARTMSWWGRCSAGPRPWQRTTATANAATARCSTATGTRARRFSTSICTCWRAADSPGLRARTITRVRSVRLQADLVSPAEAGHYVLLDYSSRRSAPFESRYDRSPDRRASDGVDTTSPVHPAPTRSRIASGNSAPNADCRLNRSTGASTITTWPAVRLAASCEIVVIVRSDSSASSTHRTLRERYTGVSASRAASSPTAAYRNVLGLRRAAAEATTPAASAVPTEGSSAYRLERTGRNKVSAYIAATHSAAKSSTRFSPSVTSGRRSRARATSATMTIAATVPARSAYSRTLRPISNGEKEKR